MGWGDYVLNVLRDQLLKILSVTSVIPATDHRVKGSLIKAECLHIGRRENMQKKTRAGFLVGTAPAPGRDLNNVCSAAMPGSCTPPFPPKHRYQMEAGFIPNGALFSPKAKYGKLQSLSGGGKSGKSISPVMV